MGRYGLSIFSDQSKSVFEYGSNEKVTVLTFQGDTDTQFPTINPNDQKKAQPGSIWTDAIKVTNPTLLACTVRSLYKTTGAFGIKSQKELVQDKNIFYHSIAETIKSGKLDFSSQIAVDIAQSQKLMICAHGDANDTDHAYLETDSGNKYSISYQDLAKYVAQHVNDKRVDKLTIDLSICYAARSALYKKIHNFDNINNEDIESSFSYKFTKELSKLLPKTPIQVKASATAVTYDYSSGLRMTELEEYFQDPKSWTKQHRGEDYFSPETLSFYHYADPVKGLYTRITESDNDEHQNSREYCETTFTKSNDVVELSAVGFQNGM